MSMPISDQTEAQDRTITTNGLRIHYREWGSAADPPVVLLHGYLCHARMFDSLARALSEHFRVLAVDQRGHGETAWADLYGPEVLLEDLESVVDALELERLSLLGYSLGGAVAYSYAARHPNSVQRLVLSETGGGAATPSPQFLAELRGWIGVHTPVDAPIEVERALREVLPRANGDALGGFVRTGLRQQADGRWTWRWDPKLLKARLAPTAEFLRRTLPNVACPALLVRGTDSVHLPLDVAERIVASLPHGELTNIPDSGNFHWFENPAGTEMVIREFLVREPDTSATH